MSSADALALEKQVRSLSEELSQCQADKDFVWSLWKRLQVEHPDLTQAVSLVVEREKHKGEMKDRKVLEILQAKDFKIHDLEQKVSEKQQEVNKLLQRCPSMDEEASLMKSELEDVNQQLLDKSKQLQEWKTACGRKEEEAQQVARALEEEKGGLTSRCVALQADLEEKERQAKHQRDQREAAQARVKDLEEEVRSAWQEVSRMQNHNSTLAACISLKEQEMATKADQLHQLGCEFAEVQTLYARSTEHAAAQSHLIKQLEGLNVETQRVMRNQEEAHTADTTSSQKLYSNLSQCYQTLMSSEAKLRQSHQELSGQLAQKEQQILQLQAQLQEQKQQRREEQLQQQQAQQTTSCISSNRQTNLKALVSEQTVAASHRLHCEHSEDKALHYISPVRRQQGAPVQRSRSLSPAGSAEPYHGGRRSAQQRIRDLEDLLRSKTEENEELRKAHNRRRERLLVVQKNYKAVKNQLKAAEKANDTPRGRMPRAEPWQLRQENSDAVWNELAYFKNLTRKLTLEKAGLEEELDMLRVQAAMDRATVKELNLCLTEEHQELLCKVEEERQVKSTSPKRPSVSSKRLEQSFMKIEQLERRMVSLEGETELLREEKQQLLQANEGLARDCRGLQASLDHLQTQEAVRLQTAQAQALALASAQGERHRGEVAALQSRLAASHKESAELHRRLLKLRQEFGILRAARDFYRKRAAGPVRPSGIAGNVSGKPKLKTIRLTGSLRQRSHPTVIPNQAISWQGRSPSPSKDEWEDMSVASDSEEYSDSLNSAPSGTRPPRRHKRKFDRCQANADAKVLAAADSSRKHLNVTNQDNNRHERWERGTRGEKRKKWLLIKASSSSSSLQHRVESLQRHVEVLRRARKAAALSARELRSTNKKMAAQLNSLAEKLSGSKQLTQKLTSELGGLDQQKKVLEMELEQWRQSTFPHRTAECSCQALEAEVKQLQAKLKSTSVEVTRQVAANKALRGQAQEKEDKLRQLQDKASHAERDVTMKRQLVDDLKTRLKFLQEMEKSYRGQVEELEKKVKCLSEEASNRKAFIESLKRRLSVATTEKAQYEASCTKLKDDLGKKEQRIQALQARVGASEQALAALEQSATEQTERLTQQRSQALDGLQRQLGQASSQLEQLRSFIKALASEMLLDVHEVKQQLMKRRRLRRTDAVAAKGGPSAKSMIKAKSIAASILNMSENDLANIMDSEQGTESLSGLPKDQEWLDQLNHILQQKIPSAGQLMEALRVKMKERKVLTEELATLATAAAVSEKA
ncbi:centlein isoform X1 [Hippocampus comes]|uniref:centlein isoform X1 n=1 Tax=Hippocampus comes TaxID=109280 RepID=UPI00094ECE2B|nr:PREDICTED: centlein isoform X1 [Hippocampus comes]XP_019717986.1 PREDICTED: centlein isoform X1 [Hippocampus comes]